MVSVSSHARLSISLKGEEGGGGGGLKGRAIVKASQEESLWHSFRRLAVNEYNLDS